MMRNSILITLFLFLFSSSNILAQEEFDEFFLDFEVIEQVVENGKIIAWATTQREDIIIDENEMGFIMPLYNATTKNKRTYVGKVILDKESQVYEEKGGQILQIELDETNDNFELLKSNKSLIKIPAKIKGAKRGLLVYDMIRLNVKMVDIYGEKDLLPIAKEEDDFFFKNPLVVMADEADFVAGEMRGQMAEPDVEKGRFKHHGLFSSMEMACEWDVRSFLIYIKEHPFKYQGTTWKFSEIFATWIIEGAPCLMYDLEDLASRKWAVDVFFLRFFRTEESETVKQVLTYLREESGQAMDDEDFERAETLVKNTSLLAKSLNDAEEIAWANYKEASLKSKKEKHEEAIPYFEKAIQYFRENDVKVGVLVVGNDMGDNYNNLAGKSNYKKAIKVLNESLDIAKGLPKDDKVISPVTALMYRNIGDSYKGLTKYEEALKMYEEGLTYTNMNHATALKRKAILLMSISEVYQLMGKSTLSKEYETQSVLAYRDYETSLAKVKNL